MHDILYNRALIAYAGWCRRHGILFQQPSPACSDIYVGTDFSVIDLCNNHRILARYLLKGGRLQRLNLPIYSS